MFKLSEAILAAIGGLVLINLLGAAEAEPPESPYTSNLTIESKFLEEGFTPDGDLTKPQWKRAVWVRYQQKYTGNADYPEAPTEVASLWSKDHVYFAYRARYTELNVYTGEDVSKERWLLWERDAVEVFLNPRPGHLNQYYEFEVAPNNMWLDLMVDLDKGKDAAYPQWDSGFEHATRVDEHATTWTAELRIPLAALKVPALRPGDSWRLNFFRMDGREAEGSTRRMTAWSTIPPSGPVHTPARFGLIRFMK